MVKRFFQLKKDPPFGGSYHKRKDNEFK